MQFVRRRSTSTDQFGFVDGDLGEPFVVTKGADDRKPILLRQRFEFAEGEFTGGTMSKDGVDMLNAKARHMRETSQPIERLEGR